MFWKAKNFLLVLTSLFSFFLALITTRKETACKAKGIMLTSATVFIFILSICLAEGSKSCPSACNCEENGKEVDCSGKNLTQIPELRAANITNLDLSFNNISAAVPPNSSVWGSQLKFLYLNHNHIKDVVKSDFQSLPKLMHVYLDYNLITVIDPHAFEGNTKLTKLTLNGNELAVTQNTPFPIVPSLGWIELANCSISHMPINFFRTMTHLEFIRLSNNKIEQLDHEMFAHLRKLRYLHLEGNQIKQIHPDIFQNNHKLQRVYLSSNPLANSKPSHLLRSSSLISLDISFCNITEIPKHFFSKLHSLESLNLSGNRLKSFNMRAVPQNLEVLDISRNSLKSVTVTSAMIRLLGSLKHLDLTNNNFTCECRLLPISKWCEKLRNENGGASSCQKFCPNRCGEPEQPNGGKTENVSVPTRTNIISEETSMEPKTNDSQEYGDVETIEVPGVDANDTHGDLRVNDERGSVGSGKMWNIIVYSSIGVLGGLCLIGAIALMSDLIIGCTKSRNRETSRSPSKNSFRNVRLELMDPIDDRQETTPLSSRCAFDFVSQPPNVHRSTKPGQLRPS